MEQNKKIFLSFLVLFLLVFSATASLANDNNSSKKEFFGGAIVIEKNKIDRENLEKIEAESLLMTFGIFIFVFFLVCLWEPFADFLCSIYYSITDFIRRGY